MKEKKTTMKAKTKAKEPPLSQVEADKLKTAIAKRFGDKTAEDNPFMTSAAFVELMKGVSIIPKALLLGTRSPVEFTNALVSTFVTMLTNVPDNVWKHLMEASQKAKALGAARPHELLGHLDALRTFGEQHHVDIRTEKGGFTIADSDEDEDMPSFTTKPPTTSV